MQNPVDQVVFGIDFHFVKFTKVVHKFKLFDQDKEHG